MITDAEINNQHSVERIKDNTKNYICFHKILFQQFLKMHM